MADVFRVRCSCNAVFLPKVRTQRECDDCSSRSLLVSRGRSIAAGFGLDRPGVVVERATRRDGRPEYVALVDVECCGERKQLKLRPESARRLLDGETLNHSEWTDTATRLGHQDTMRDGRVFWFDDACGTARLVTREWRDAENKRIDALMAKQKAEWEREQEASRRASARLHVHPMPAVNRVPWIRIVENASIPPGEFRLQDTSASDQSDAVREYLRESWARLQPMAETRGFWVDVDGKGHEFEETPKPPASADNVKTVYSHALMSHRHIENNSALSIPKGDQFYVGKAGVTCPRCYDSQPFAGEQWKSLRSTHERLTCGECGFDAPLPDDVRARVAEAHRNEPSTRRFEPGARVVHAILGTNEELRGTVVKPYAERLGRCGALVQFDRLAASLVIPFDQLERAPSEKSAAIQSYARELMSEMAGKTFFPGRLGISATSAAVSAETPCSVVFGCHHFKVDVPSDWLAAYRRGEWVDSRIVRDLIAKLPHMRVPGDRTMIDGAYHEYDRKTDLCRREAV